MGKFREYPWLQSSLYSYLLLGITDTVHHLHAAKSLGHSTAMHAVWTGVVLIPVALLSAYGFVVYRRKVLLWVFMSIALLAVILPGIYHGGWDHLMKILAHLRLEGEGTDIRSLFPPEDKNLWFYEVTGTAEFLISLIALYFLSRLFTSSRVQT